ncbi:MAG: hypothetical protein K2I54_04545, partial [Muribaculaceae bacterium]|nr:hypothetical protein [Muribaculaceae bacterium]
MCQFPHAHGILKFLDSRGMSGVYIIGKVAGCYLRFYFSNVVFPLFHVFFGILHLSGSSLEGCLALSLLGLA